MSTSTASPAPAWAPPEWSLTERIAFRFVAVYLVLYGFGETEIASILPGFAQLAKGYEKLWHVCAPWVAIHVFGLSRAATVYTQDNGSGDTTLDYVKLFCYVALSLGAALLWSILDRWRREYRRLHAWLRIWVRYALAFTLFTYGFAKIFPLQFSPPRLDRLVEPLHEFSPMGLMWTFMGFSPGYRIFSGVAEVAAGLLLVFRRTTSLGSLAAGAVLINVVALNLCFDVAAKLFSINLLFMAIFLMAPDLGRLTRLLVLNRPAMPSKTDAILFTSRPVRIASIAVKTLFIALVLFGQARGAFLAYRSFPQPNPPLYGVWRVEKFTRNGQLVQPLATDSTCWRRLIVDRPSWMTVQMADDSRSNLDARYDATTRTVWLNPSWNRVMSYAFHYSGPADRITLTGKLAADDLVIELRRIDQGFRLTHRGFHWITERPFNR